MERPGGVNLNFNQLILKIRWPLFGVIGIILLVIELAEHPGALQGFDPVFLSEIILLEGLLIFVGLTIGWLLKTIHEKTETVKILETKNELSQQLTVAQDWDQVTESLVGFPRRILPVTGSSLLIYSPQSNQYELTAYWVSDPTHIESVTHFQLNSNCTQCQYQGFFQLRQIDGYCTNGDTKNSRSNCYCLPLSYSSSDRALLHLCLPEGHIPDSDQANLINNLGPEITIALKVAQENRYREQLVAEQAAEDVRKIITRDMHDMLAQNLAYLQLKLDQLTSDGNLREFPQVEKQVLDLCDVADESFELVRGTLEALHPNNTKRLADILSQHVYNFADRENIEIEFTHNGAPRPLNPLILYNVFQIFREALNNIAKHAEASHVTVDLNWHDTELSLRISDDGRGFDPRMIDHFRHFGISTMHEHIKQLNGQLLIESSPGEGTSVTVVVPLQENGD